MDAIINVDRKDIISTIKEKIQQSGMMQKAVAEKAGMDEQALSSFLNNKRGLSATEFLGLLWVLGISIEEIPVQKR